MREYVAGAPSGEGHVQFPEVSSFALVVEPTLNVCYRPKADIPANRNLSVFLQPPAESFKAARSLTRSSARFELSATPRFAL
jgi:hypothetical protein